VRGEAMTTSTSRVYRLMLPVVIAFSLLAITAPRAEDSDALAGEIDGIHTRYLTAFNQRDAASLAALFAEDASFVDPGGKIVAGRGAIEAMFAQAFGDAELTLEASADRIGSLGDGAWDIGHGAQTTRRAGSMQRMALHYTAIYQRRAGALQIRVVSVGAE
jgi:uncharacterized protein (TIGR02246 family)